MTLSIELGPKTRQFQDELRQFLEANHPEGLSLEDPNGAGGADGVPLEWDEWADTLSAAGYMCVSWPTEFGGRGLSGIEVAVMNEEFARAGVPRVTRGMGEGLVGPAIIVWGTDEQKA